MGQLNVTCKEHHWANMTDLSHCLVQTKASSYKCIHITEGASLVDICMSTKSNEMAFQDVSVPRNGCCVDLCTLLPFKSLCIYQLFSLAFSVLIICSINGQKTVKYAHCGVFSEHILTMFILLPYSTKQKKKPQNHHFLPDMSKKYSDI